MARTNSSAAYAALEPAVGIEAAAGPLTAARHPDRTAADRARGLAVWTFLVFVFSIPLEYPGRTTLPEVHTITGLAAIALTLLYRPSWFATVPRPMWPLAAFLWIYIARALFTEHQSEAVRTWLQYGLVAAVFWIAIRFVAHRDLARRTLMAFTAGGALIALFQQLGIATTLVAGRRVVFDQDANLLGGNMAIALVAVLCLYFEHLRRPSAKMAALGVMLLLGAALVASGSRGAILSAGGGLVGLTLQAGPGRKPLRRAAFIGAIAALAIIALASSQMMRQRFEEAAEGKLARRERIFPAAWEMIRQHPIVGWGPADANYSLAVRSGEYGMGRRVGDERITPHKRDFHNLPLDLLGTVGLAGAVPMAVCLGMCVWSAWIGRRGREGSGPLALLIVTLLLSLSGNRILSKQTWIVFAYAYVSGYTHRATRAVPEGHPVVPEAAAGQPRVVRLPRGSSPVESRSRRAAR